MERIIFHCDLNSFYASVELLDHPELRHLPPLERRDHPSFRHYFNAIWKELDTHG